MPELRNIPSKTTNIASSGTKPRPSRTAQPGPPLRSRDHNSRMSHDLPSRDSVRIRQTSKIMNHLSTASGRNTNERPTSQKPAQSNDDRLPSSEFVFIICQSLYLNDFFV